MLIWRVRETALCRLFTTLQHIGCTLPPFLETTGTIGKKMRQEGHTKAPVWFAAGGSAKVYHAEDACYYDFESENKQTSGKAFYTGGKKIASYGYLIPARKNKPGNVVNPCGVPAGNTPKQPTCVSVAKDLHVVWKDHQEYNDGECNSGHTYNEADGKMYDEHMNVIGENVFDETTGKHYYTTEKRRRSGGKAVGTTTVACVQKVSMSIASSTKTGSSTSETALATETESSTKASAVSNTDHTVQTTLSTKTIPLATTISPKVEASVSSQEASSVKETSSSKASTQTKAADTPTKSKPSTKLKAAKPLSVA